MEERRLIRKIMMVARAIQTVLLLILADAATASPPRKVIMDYIGASGIDITVRGVPISPDVDFYLLLAFAIDATVDGQPNKGIFNSFWSAAITPQSIAALKARHRNVKVLGSLAGDIIYVSDTNQPKVVWNDPENPDQWIQNAVQSLTTMANKWHLDGYDINYENFNSNKQFTFCIGQLITQLKDNSVITVVTLAPFSNTEQIYQDLYQKYSDVIDYVNYQFYADDLSSVSQYVTHFRDTVAKYNAHGKTTASVQLYKAGLHLHDFLSVVATLLKTDDLAGVMMWDLDASSKQRYAAERALQALLKTA